jgi:hypothetical protein
MLEQCIFQRIFIDRRCGRMAAELVAERRRRRLIWREISTRTSTFAAAPELQAAGPLRGCRTLRAIECLWQTPNPGAGILAGILSEFGKYDSFFARASQP